MKTPVKISESELCKLIKDSTMNVLNKHNDSAEREQLRDYLSKIPEEALKRQNVNLKITKRVFNFDNKYVKENINESATYSVPLDDVKKELKKKYGLEDWQFRIIQGSNQCFISVIFTDNDMNASIIENEMDSFGYFKSHEMNVDMNGIIWIQMQFEPRFQNNENNLIRNMRFLSHITPKYNFENIKNSGFIPSYKNDFFRYPDRVYFVKGTATKEEILNLAVNLYKWDKDPRNTGEYYILDIDLTMVPNDVDFYLDPNSDIGVFTEQPIPYSSVIGFRKYDFSGLKHNNR